MKVKGNDLMCSKLLHVLLIVMIHHASREIFHGQELGLRIAHTHPFKKSHSEYVLMASTRLYNREGYHDTPGKVY